MKMAKEKIGTDMDRVAITGGVKSGKTTISFILRDQMEVSPILAHTDDLIGQTWGSDTSAISDWLTTAKPPFIIEGVSIPRALRKWISIHGAENQSLPIDILYVIEGEREPTSKRQQSMSRGVFTVLEEILPELIRRGCTVIRLSPS